ncbi:unnamed protein product, partial [Tuber aestivum]
MWPPYPLQAENHTYGTIRGSLSADHPLVPPSTQETRVCPSTEQPGKAGRGGRLGGVMSFLDLFMGEVFYCWRYSFRMSCHNRLSLHLEFSPIVGTYGKFVNQIVSVEDSADHRYSTVPCSKRICETKTMKCYLGR